MSYEEQQEIEHLKQLLCLWIAHEELFEQDLDGVDDTNPIDVNTLIDDSIAAVTPTDSELASMEREAAQDLGSPFQELSDPPF